MHQLYICITQQHDVSMLIVAAIVCALGSFSFGVLGRHAAATRDRAVRLRWTAATVLATTSAIWATHFIAMLAFRVSIPAGFEIGATIMSFVIAVGLVGIATYIAVEGASRRSAAIGGFLIGLAISAMHYTGMSAFRVVGTVSWDLPTVVVSIAVGAVFATLASLFAFRSRLPPALPTLMLTLAICGDHFIAMSAATVAYDPRVDLPPGLIEDRQLVPVVALIAAVIIGTVLTALIQNRRMRRRDEVEKQQLQHLSDVAVEGLAICEGSKIVWINSSLERMLPGVRADHVGESIQDLLDIPSLESVPHDHELDAMLRSGPGVEERVPVRVIARDLVVAGSPHRVVAIRDQRERLRAEAEMHRLANQDSLTGLANRARFHVVLERMFAAPRSRRGNFALLSLDLDRFKSINDTYGHLAGDAVLVEVAARLQALVREHDLVARLGGDEFSIIAAKGDGVQEIGVLADRVIAVMGQPFRIEGNFHQIGASVGVAFAMVDGDDTEALIRSADLALYRAKDDGGGVPRFFENGMKLRMQERHGLEQALRLALERRELLLHFQPQIDAHSGAFNGAEALIRWQHPTRGLVPPADFVPLAEKTHLIFAIGEWVLREACREAAAWPAHLVVAVNLSPVQFRDPALPAIVAAALEAAGLPGHRLELEVTESVLLEDAFHVGATLEAFRQLGIRISLDDFGTGYSSLGHLRDYRFDKIKIDRSFISRALEDRDSAAIVRAVISLGAGLGLQTTAEGVETEAQRRFVSEAGIDQIQGFMFSQPVVAAGLPNVFRTAGAEVVSDAVASIVS